MNIYELQYSTMKHFIAAESEQHAYELGTDVEKFPDIHYLPFTITQIVVPGHTITVVPDEAEDELNEPDAEPDEFDAMEKPELLTFLKDNEIDHKPQWGEKRMREAARAFVASSVAD